MTVDHPSQKENPGHIEVEDYIVAYVPRHSYGDGLEAPALFVADPTVNGRTVNAEHLGDLSDFVERLSFDHSFVPSFAGVLSP